MNNVKTSLKAVIFGMKPIIEQFYPKLKKTKAI